MPPHPMFSWPNRTHCCRFPFRKSFAGFVHLRSNSCQLYQFIPTIFGRFVHFSQILSRFPDFKSALIFTVPDSRRFFSNACAASLGVQCFFGIHCKSNLLHMLFCYPAPASIAFGKSRLLHYSTISLHDQCAQAHIQIFTSLNFILTRVPLYRRTPNTCGATLLKESCLSGSTNRYI